MLEAKESPSSKGPGMSSSLRLDLAPLPESLDPAKTPSLVCPPIRVSVHAEIGAVENEWRHLEMIAPHSAYQKFDWVQAWLDNIAPHVGTRPCIVLGRGPGGAPAFILPLGLRHGTGFTLGGWLGGKHANYNMGLYAPEIAGRLDRATLSSVLAEAGRAAGIHAFALLNQPFAWQGYANPLAALPHRPSAADAWHQNLEAHFDDFLLSLRGSGARRRLRWRERRMSGNGRLRMERAATPEAARVMARIMLDQKAERFRAQGRANDLAEPGVEDFVMALAAGAGPRSAALEIYALMNKEETLAICGGGNGSGRFSCYFNSITAAPSAKFGPSEVLIARLLEQFCDDRLSGFDLGIGDNAYKELWCRREPLFDTFFSIGGRGRAVAAALGLFYGAKGKAKRNPQAARLLARFRNRSARTAQPEATEASD